MQKVHRLDAGRERTPPEDSLDALMKKFKDNPIVEEIRERMHRGFGGVNGNNYWDEYDERDAIATLLALQEQSASSLRAISTNHS